MDDPVRGEKLRGRRNVFFGDLYVLLKISKNLILGLGVVILVQPADDLHLIGSVFLRNGGDHLLNHAALAKQVIREQQLGIVVDP